MQQIQNYIVDGISVISYFMKYHVIFQYILTTPSCISSLVEHRHHFPSPEGLQRDDLNCDVTVSYCLKNVYKS